MNSVIWLVMVSALSTAPREEPTVPSFWVDLTRFSPPQAEAITSALERMAGDEGKVRRSDRREEADLFLRLSLGSLRTESSPETPGASLGARPDGTDGPGGLEAAPPTGASMARFRISLANVSDGDELYQRDVRCRLPFSQGRRLSDPGLRANLSQVMDVMEDWASERSSSGKVDNEPFGPSESQRQSLKPEELAKHLYLEGRRAALAGYEEQALSLLAEAQPMFKRGGLRKLEGESWAALGELMATTGHSLEKAVRYAGQAAKIAREVSNTEGEARALTSLAVVEAASANYPRAIELLMTTRRQGSPLIEGASLANIAGLTAIRGSFEQARKMQEEALALIQAGGNERAEGRLRLAMAVVQSKLDGRDRAGSLAELDAVEQLARDRGDLALLRDVAFVRANVHLSTRDLGQLRDGELDAVRALQLSRKLGDLRGEAAGLALVGAFSQRLLRPAEAADLLARAQNQARAGGYLELTIDTLQLLGEMAPNSERAISIFDDVLLFRRERGDLRGEVKTLSDMSRLYAGLEQDELAWEHYRRAVETLGRYVEERRASPYAEDVRESFITTLKSLIASRTELPYLEHTLELRHLVLMPDPSWTEAGS